MKSCGQCERENPEDALRCWKCGSTLEVAAVEAQNRVDFQSEPSTSQENSSPSDQQPSPTLLTRYPVEYWVFLPTVLSTTGWYYHFVAIVVWYFVLGWMRPKADYELRMVACGYLGFGTMDIIQSSNQSGQPYAILYTIASCSVAFVLICGQSRFWAWLLLVISAVVALLFLLGSALLTSFKPDAPVNLSLGLVVGLVHSFWVWLLVRWLRRTAASKLAGSTAGDLADTRAPLTDTTR
jgi:hypothetical protein